jgi:hypothetical protein
MENTAIPYPSNGYFFLLQNSGFEPSCHNIYLEREIKSERKIINGKINKEINKKSSKFHEIIKVILWSAEIPKQCKATIYKVYFTPIPINSTEHRPLQRETKAKSI